MFSFGIFFEGIGKRSKKMTKMTPSIVKFSMWFFINFFVSHRTGSN